MFLNQVKSRTSMLSVILIVFISFVLVLNFFYINDQIERLKQFNFLTIKNMIFKTNKTISSTQSPMTSSQTISNVSNTNKDRLIEYYKIHARIYAQQNASLKKISFNGYTPGGYANKLYSFLTSLIIAILTESQLVVKWKYIDKFITPPFNLNLFENITDNGIEFKNKSIHFDSSQAWSLNKNINALMNTVIPLKGYLRYFYNSIDPFFMEICSNPLYFKTFLHYNLASRDTISKALNVISNKNSSQLELKEKLFKVGFEVGGNY